MLKNRKFLVLLMMSLVTLTALAQENLSLQGCRRGTPRPESSYPLLRRGGSEGRIPGGDFYHGERHQLTVLVAFNDRLFVGDESATMEQWNKIFNTKNLTEEPFKGSVHDYFYDQSYGDFSLVFDLEYVQVSGNAKKYASTEVDDENSQYLVEDIMEELNTRDIDWSRYDWDGNGYVNQLLIVYAGHGMNDYSGNDLIWPHQWWMSEHLKDRQPGVYCDPIPVSYGGKKYMVDCYCALAELTRNNDYGSFGTICHEFTHCFGFPDFYNGSTKYVAGWDLMDYGNYNGDGYLPAGYSAHERMLMGWLTPIELKDKKSIVDMPALSETGEAYLIRNDGWENEYYIVENRQAVSWDSGLPGSGVMVFHIDYDPSIWTSTKEYTNTSSKQRYVLFHANNTKAVYGKWGYPYLDNDSLTNYSSPVATLNNENSDGTKLMNKSLRDIAVAGGLASFRFTVDSSTGIDELKAEGEPRELYRIGPVSILRYPNGVVRKVVRAKSTKD